MKHSIDHIFRDFASTQRRKEVVGAIRTASNGELPVDSIIPLTRRIGKSNVTCLVSSPDNHQTELLINEQKVATFDFNSGIAGVSNVRETAGFANAAQAAMYLTEAVLQSANPFSPETLPLLLSILAKNFKANSPDIQVNKGVNGHKLTAGAGNDIILLAEFILNDTRVIPHNVSIFKPHPFKTSPGNNIVADAAEYLGGLILERGLAGTKSKDKDTAKIAFRDELAERVIEAFSK